MMARRVLGVVLGEHVKETPHVVPRLSSVISSWVDCCFAWEKTVVSSVQPSLASPGTLERLFFHQFASLSFLCSSPASTPNLTNFTQQSSFNISRSEPGSSFLLSRAPPQFTSVVNVTYPDIYQRFLNIADVVNFDLSWVLSTGCVLDVDFHDRLLVSTICPLIALMFLGGTYSAAARANRGNSQVLQVIWNKHVSVVLLLTFLVYSSVSSVVFQTFACEELDDGRVYLRADYRIECDSPRHKGFQAYAGIMAVLYAFGIPAFYSALLLRDRHVLRLDPAGREDPARVTSTSQLWKHYKPSAFYYEVIECARRLSLAGLVVFVYPNTASQIAITLMLTFLFAVLSEAFAPYASRWDAWTSRMSHAVIFMSVYVALLLKVDVSDEQGSSQKVFEAVLVFAHVCMVLTIVLETIAIAYSFRVEQIDSPVCKIQPVDYEDNPFASHVREVERSC